MGTTANVPVTPGSGLAVATYAITEDAITKEIQRVVSSDSSGAEIIPPTATQMGSLTETVPATDTASSGLNGRLQRIAQRISSLIALLPAALGAGGGLKVDGSGTALPVSGTVTSRGVGNAGAILDFAGQNATAPANSLLVGAEFNTSPTTLTSGNASPLQLDNAGNLLVNIKAGASSGAVAQGSTTSGQTGSLIQGAVTTAAPTYTTAQTSPLSLDTTGALRVNVTAGGAGGGIVTQVTAANLNATVQLSDGTHAGTIKAASTAPATTDTSLVVAQNPNSLDFGSGTGGSKTQRTILDSASPGIIATGTQASPSTAYLSTVAAGDVAAVATDSGNPVKIGGVGHTANPAAVTDGQRVNAIFDKLGKQVVVGSVRDLKGNQFTMITSSTSETTVVTAVASTFLDVYGCIVENTSATACKVTFKDSTAGTTQFEIYVPAGDTRGFVMPESGAFKQTTVNTAWTATCGTSVSSIVVSMLYVKNI